mmetsp:Transcript_25140/g.37994  ORF Transcript_25140/g.37994 Transcript_25140/m.37994 type:complete len:770 (+) Transcript_25140:70-2379(+)
MARTTACFGLMFALVHGFTVPSNNRCFVFPPSSLFIQKVDEASDLVAGQLNQDTLLREELILEGKDDTQMLDTKTNENTGEHDLIDQFIDLVENIDQGKLSNDEIMLLRSTMQDLAVGKQEDPEENAKKLDILLNRLLDEFVQAAQSGNESRIKLLDPSAEEFLLTMKAWLKIGDKSAARKAAEIFFEQEEIFDSTGLCTPTSDTIQVAIDALALSRERGADRKAKALVDRLSKFNVSPTPQIFTSLIASMARDKSRGSCFRAEQILEEALEIFPPDVDEDGVYTGMTVDAFNIVLTGWAKSDRNDGPERARNLLLRMEAVDANREILKPTVQSFTSLIDAYAQKNTWEGACEAERTLNALLREYLELKDESLEPNIATFGIVLSCWSRVSKRGSTDAASKADKLLMRMEDLFQSGRLSFGPDAIAYVTVLLACVNSKNKIEAPIRAVEILDETNERYLDGDDSFKPSAKSIRAVIEAFVKSGRQDASFKAEEVFKKYDEYLLQEEDDKIVNDIFQSMIFGWGKNCDPGKAHEVLVEMIDRNLKPDSFCFDRVIEAYTLEEAANLGQIKEVFELMENCSANGDLEPNERVYTSFIRALTKAKVASLGQKAWVILERMKMLYELGNKGIKPTVFTYNAVLHACVEAMSDDATENLETFKVALKAFNTLVEDDERLDHVTYGNMLRCSALLPQGSQREAVIATIFDRCCRNGFINSYVIRDLVLVANEELWRDLCQCSEGEINTKSLPAAWTKCSRKDKEVQVRQRNRRGS